MEWGSEIKVNGVRPEWLGKEEYQAKSRFNAIGWYGTQYNGTPHIWNREPNGDPIWDGGNITAIRLPADHPYYLATSRGFTYWPGGDEAPSDWDGGPVLARDGDTFETFDYWGHGHLLGSCDIIGYRKKPNFRADVEEFLDAIPPIAPSGDNGDYYDITINGNIISCNDVIDALGLSFNHGELFKAAWRLGRKPGTDTAYDLDKIIYFAKRMAR